MPHAMDGQTDGRIDLHTDRETDRLADRYVNITTREQQVPNGKL